MILTSIISLVGGIAFAVIAAWLTTRRGNTISDVLKSAHLKDAEAIKIEILGKIKLRSTIPIVGLYVIACIVAILPPMYVTYINKKGEQIITLQGTVDGEKPILNVDIIPMNMTVTPSGWFNIPLMDRSGSQTVNFQSLHYEPLTMNVNINKEDDTLTVSFSNYRLKDERLELDSTRAAKIQQHPPLIKASKEEAVPENVASVQSPITSIINSTVIETSTAPVSMERRRR